MGKINESPERASTAEAIAKLCGIWPADIEMCLLRSSFSNTVLITQRQELEKHPWILLAVEIARVKTSLTSIRLEWGCPLGGSILSNSIPLSPHGQRRVTNQ